MNENYESVMDINIKEDIDNALERFGGNKALCVRLIKKLIDKDYALCLKEAFDLGEIKNILEILHAAKGASANIGLNGLSEIFRTLESDIKNVDKIPNNIDKILSGLSKALKNLEIETDNL